MIFLIAEFKVSPNSNLNCKTESLIFSKYNLLRLLYNKVLLGRKKELIDSIVYPCKDVNLYIDS